MSQNTKPPRRLHSASTNKNKTSLLQLELEQTLVHLETVLMLAQLNSTYYQLALNLHHYMIKIEMKYFRNKMDAFMAIQDYNYSQMQRNRGLEAMEKMGRTVHVDNQPEGRNEVNLAKVFEKYKRRANYQQIATNTTVKCQQRLQRMGNLITNKNKMFVSFALLRLQQHRQQSFANIYSQKSSKIQTNDSQKSKLFRRSVDKKDNRKSFSLQKSGLSPKHDYYVPVKYQPSKKTGHLIPEQKHMTDNSNISSSMLNRFLQKMEPYKQRRNTLQLDRDKKQSNKHSSTRKYNSSLANHQRQEKISQLEYLKRKYKKLIDQFGCFSERFLKAIEQEEYVQ